jgi:serine/threonine protein kinase/Flp pilus assembly protein TadD
VTLDAGTKLGRYEIRSKIGEGGMGEVYLAEDTRLHRKVALKTLPGELNADEDRIGRFEQEATAAAALNHPNIAHIYEIGGSPIVREGANANAPSAQETHFIAMEFIDGQTLRERMRSAPMKLSEVLDVSAQIASALSAAHAVGIVHRDIKPTNIMLRSDGLVKVLDFGLAKLSEQSGIANLNIDTEASTQAAIKTEPGMVMGTARYMSPEQARGFEVDARSDIWSLGVVLYEMVAGRSPFKGATTIDTLSMILRHEPPSLLLDSTRMPAEIERIVEKALAKERAQRYPSAKDLLSDLRSLQKRLEFDAELERTTPSAKFGLWSSDRGLRTAPLTEKDAIVLADFVNITGDIVFDGALKHALAIHLEQSPFLNIFSDQRVREALRFMDLSPDERVTKDVAREICEREGLKAYLTGSISNLGTLFVIGLEAVNARTGDTIARQQAEAKSKEQVLSALGNVATRLREKLGESLTSIQKYDAPIHQATTSSLEALKAFSLGVDQQLKGLYLEAIPFFRHATELDPNFAHAYATMSSMYYNSRQYDLAAEASRKAYRLRDRVGEHERLYIAAVYYDNVSGELEKYLETLELWKRTYPRDREPHNSLAQKYDDLGQFEKAEEEAREAIRLNPNAASGYSILATALVGLGRFDEAKEIICHAVLQKLESTKMHQNLYRIAFVKGDTEGMRQEIEWASGKPEEHVAQTWQAETAAFSGQLRKAKQFSTTAFELAQRRDLKEVAAQIAAGTAGVDALFGDCTQVKKQTARALEISRSQFTLALAAAALATCGELDETKFIVDELRRRFPTDTLLNKEWLPLIQAHIEMHQGNAAQALQLLETARLFEGCLLFPIIYVRAHAYLTQRKGAEAAAEFQKLLDNQGWQVNSALCPLAHLGAARAAAHQGDTAKACQAYQNFFALWKDADADAPILIEAKKEYARVSDSASLSP